MNLSTARASKRSKEIGVKKTIGARRSSLISQYLFESILLSFIALVVSFGLIQVLLPTFNTITEKELSLQFHPAFLLATAGITLLTGLLAGSYPALYLSGIQPIQVLKGKLSPSSGNSLARKSLVVFQFTISILLIIGVIVVYKQLDFIQNKQLGYKKDNVLLFQKDGAIKEEIESFIQEVRKIPGVEKAATLDGTMTGNYGYTTTFRWEGYKNPENPVRIGVMIVGNDIIETLGMKMKSGLSFTEDLPDQPEKILINEAAAKVFGFENPIGKLISQRNQNYEIAGVIEDFHFESLYDNVKPCVLKRGTYGNNIYVKVNSASFSNTIGQLEDLYQGFNPGLNFSYRFIDEDYQRLYAAEQRVAVLARYFALIAILISCLGLLGLAAFSAERRAKEMSIRKILGASTLQITRLLSSTLLQLVFIAYLIGIPLGWWLMDRRLEKFAFKVNLGLNPFILAAFLTFFIAISTIAFQSFKTALNNPVNYLRND